MALAVLREAVDPVDQKVVVVLADQKADADRVVQSSVEVPVDLKVVVVPADQSLVEDLVALKVVVDPECVDLKVSSAAAGQ